MDKQKKFNNLYYDKKIPLMNKRLLNIYIEENKKINLLTLNNILFFIIVFSLIFIIYILYVNHNKVLKNTQ